MKVIKTIALILVIIGALNWGLVGVLELDLVAYLFGASSMISRIVYSLVGLSGLALIFFEFIKMPMKQPMMNKPAK